jgi:hypothetical protein
MSAEGGEAEAGNNVPNTSNSGLVFSKSAGTPGLSDEVLQLEQQILATTYTQEPMPDRVKRLEEKVFPNERTEQDADLPERVRRLWAVMELTAPPQVTYTGASAGSPGRQTDAIAGSSDNPPPQYQTKPRHPLLSGLAKAAGVVGKLAGEAVGAVGTGILYGSMYGGLGY